MDVAGTLAGLRRLTGIVACRAVLGSLIDQGIVREQDYRPAGRVYWIDHDWLNQIAEVQA